jgi:beta-lactamase superfamily II metal-dependent hydrolase
MNCEIEFLPVGDGCKPGDAIVVRYGDVNAYELMVIDGGNLDSGKVVVSHIRNNFGYNAVVAHAVVTHPDADHASGMREVLEALPVKNLWLHKPWEFAAASRPYFANKSWTDQGLAAALRKEYDIIRELVDTAEKKKITVQQPFAGMSIGPFRVASPFRNVYPYFIPQFDRTPEPDQAAIEAAGFWIGKPPGLLANLFEKAAAKIQKWIDDSWDNERLKDGGCTSATNESSVVLYGDFGPGRRVLLTGDAGIWGLSMAKCFADQNGLALQDFMLVQVPHHGSRRNVGPTILNSILGPIKPNGTPAHSQAYVSAPKDDDTHPRKMVLNAFMRRGYSVAATQGNKIVYWGGFPPRPGYGPLSMLPFSPKVEDYD